MIDHNFGARTIDVYLARLLFIQFAVTTSPLFDYIGAPSSILTVLFFLVSMSFIGFYVADVSRRYILFSCVIFSIFIFFAIYWGDFKLGFYPIYFIQSLIIFSSLSFLGVKLFARYMFFYMFLIVFFSVLSSIYFLLGGGPLFSILNTDGRINNMYLLSFSNSNNGFLIRPSGSFDEAGALSFHLCMILAFRRMTGQNNKFDLPVLFMGFVTLSLAHLVFSFMYFLSLIKNIKSFFQYLFIFFIVVSSSLFFLKDTSIGSYAQSRMTINEDGSLRGDSRSGLISNAFSKIDSSILFAGIDSKCMTSYSDCVRKYGAMGENPISPLIFMGVILSLPYYMFLIILVTFPRGTGNKIIGLSIALLFMQRPYFYHIGYTMWVALLLIYLFGKHRVSNQN
jgi:hypothetical protein